MLTGDHKRRVLCSNGLLLRRSETFALFATTFVPVERIANQSSKREGPATSTGTSIVFGEA